MRDSAPTHQSLIARALMATLRFYKHRISPVLPASCRFHPTCSEFAHMAVAKYGVARGLWKTAGRLLRCHPFHPGGVDYP